jgi:3-dehydroquinate synthase
MTMHDPAPPADRQDGALIWQEFQVSYAYPVAFTRDLFSPENPILDQTLSAREPDKHHRCLIYVDQGLLDADPGLMHRVEEGFARRPRLSLVASPIPLPGGEAIKIEPGFADRVRGDILTHGIDRHSYVIAIGGGALLDAVGFGAATAHRGVRHVRVPTTVLSQNDSGVGVKNAVNFRGVKNFTGSFAPPWAVLNDFDLLASLPRRERVAGLAEAVKVALIRDGAFFAWLEANADRLAGFEQAAEEWMIRRCAELHMNQIAHGGDPFEFGSARPLDFGHWAAHRLETLTEHALRHGEAVAIGIALDARYSVLAGLLPEGAEERIARLLERLGFTLPHPALERRDASGELAVLRGLREFREHLGGELTVTLLEGLGRGIEVHEMDPERVAQAIRWVQGRGGAA